MKIFQSAMAVLLITVFAAAADRATGDWAAVIKVRDMDLHLALHISDSGKGLRATFDSIDQKVIGMPVDKVELEGQQLKFEISVIGATYTGTLNKAGTELTGTWSQVGMDFPLAFRKAPGAKR